MSEKIQLTDHQIKTAAWNNMYASNEEKALLTEVFIVHQKKHGGFESDSVHRMLQHIHDAGLITEGAAQMAQQKIFQAAA